MKIVDQPIGGGRDGAFLVDRPGNGPIGRAQRAIIITKAARQASICRKRRCNALCGGKALAMLLETFDAEELGPNRLFGRLGKNGGSALEGTNDKMRQYR